MYPQTDVDKSDHDGNGSNGSGSSGDQQIFHRREEQVMLQVGLSNPVETWPMP